MVRLARNRHAEPLAQGPEGVPDVLAGRSLVGQREDVEEVVVDARGQTGPTERQVQKTPIEGDVETREHATCDEAGELTEAGHSVHRITPSLQRVAVDLQGLRVSVAWPLEAAAALENAAFGDEVSAHPDRANLQNLMGARVESARLEVEDNEVGPHDATIAKLTVLVQFSMG